MAMKSDLVYANISVVGSPGSKTLRLTDVDTGKTIRFKHERASEDALLSSFTRLIEGCVNGTGHIPGTVMFVSTPEETDNELWLDWTSGPPAISFTGAKTLTCHVRETNDRFDLVDTATSRKVTLKHLHKNEGLYSTLTEFYMSGHSNEYSKENGRKLILCGFVVDSNREEIILDALKMTTFGDKDNISASFVQDMTVNI